MMKDSELKPIWMEHYPFQSHTLNLGGNTLHYVDEGAGEPILMVHGNPTWSFYYRRLIQAFRGTHRTVAPDHIGMGLSDKPQDFNYTLASHISNLKWLINELDLRDITLVVHDWGGAIGLGAAVDQPERFKRLVILNTAAFPPPFIPKRIAICRWPIFGSLAVRGFNAFARAATTMTVEDKANMSPTVQAGYLAPYDSWANRVAVHSFVKDIPTKSSDWTWKKLAAIRDGLAKLGDKPARFYWGMKDWCFTPAILETMTELLPNAQVQRFENAGHYVLEDAHEPIIESMKLFLSERGA